MPVKLGGNLEYRILETLDPRKLFRGMFVNNNPQKLCASKIWMYTVVYDLSVEFCS